MFSLINILGIIEEHYETLKSDAKLRFIILIFFLIPLLVAFLLIITNKPLTQNSVNALITAYSIFTALLLNVIFIIYDIMGKLKITDKDTTDDIAEYAKNRNQKELLEHLYSNSVYSLLTSIIILTILILEALIEVWRIEGYILCIFSGFTYIMVAHFLMNLLMITKRLSSLLSSKLDSI